MPHIYHITFREKNSSELFHDYWGLHLSWENAWRSIYRFDVSKDKEYVVGTMLTWRMFFMLLTPWLYDVGRIDVK